MSQSRETVFTDVPEVRWFNDDVTSRVVSGTTQNLSVGFTKVTCHNIIWSRCKSNVYFFVTSLFSLSPSRSPTPSYPSSVSHSSPLSCPFFSLSNFSPSYTVFHCLSPPFPSPFQSLVSAFFLSSLFFSSFVFFFFFTFSSCPSY